MAEPWILAVDLGTGGPKTGAVSLDGELLAVAHRSVSTTFTSDGGAEQDPEAWWRGIHAGVAEVLASGVAPGDAIGVGITGQWGSTVPVGNGRHGRGAVQALVRHPRRGACGEAPRRPRSTSLGTRPETSSRGCA